MLNLIYSKIFILNYYYLERANLLYLQRYYYHSVKTERNLRKFYLN